MTDSQTVLIFGKDTWPYTTEAREAYKGKGYTVDYRNVSASQDALSEMLEHSGGQRSVPVIVEDGQVTLGYGGTW